MSAGLGRIGQECKSGWEWVSMPVGAGGIDQ